MTRIFLIAIIVTLLAACSGASDDAPVLERVASAPVLLSVDGEGSLRSSKATPLPVPGSQWAQRQLIWAVDDGSFVKEGDVVARFSAHQSELELATALIDLQRTALSRVAKEDELGDTQGKLQVDLSQVAGLLGIARRYANAAEQALARNAILDAVQDEHFLGVKQETLNWRKGNSSTRGHAELALIDAQKATNDVLAKGKRGDLEALELRAPHAGVFVLEANWTGEKPRVGSNLWAGTPFASLPDTTQMEVEIAIPQSETAGIKAGIAVELAPLGAPEQKIESTLSWVASAPAARSRESPVKYLTMKASIPADAVQRFHWVPGQNFSAHVILLKSDNALTIPNIALDSQGDTATVNVRSGGGTEKRTVRVGVRGPSRAQVLDGLKSGEEIVISNDAAKVGSDGATGTASAAAKAPP